MIYQTLNKYEFVQAFDDMGRGENFSVAARAALYDYYMGMADVTGEPFVLDVIAVCCDWTEYTAEELVADYGTPDSSLEDVLAELERDQFVLVVEYWSDPDTYLVQH